ncbi:protein SINE1-like [Magnolia sinica]|uniref:protein SINE1-like n=1 Tax=Magnolia sinica TaxID=86752 RepID=UPI00265926AF|nr:protein SINE1-like [Magnolia sinica]XP_058105869.1 protein SINE1-like [Magnolia sinica]XP_058105870.1 protein SINE1-like [Magnolia sinica]
MGRNLSPILRRELANLDKDADSRKTAMKALKSYVKDLDSKAIPQFLAQVSETKGPGSSSGEYTISLYEVLARVHGRNIVPQIDNIMLTIVNTLTSSAGSFPLHQACSKVVPAIARYGIDPSTPEEEKVKIIQSLCKPLSSVLMGPAESVASGAALCLKALVESDNWRFASDEAVNDVCLRVAGALEEKLTQTNSHMGLVMALAKHNSLIVEAYARSLIRSGLQILTAGVAEGNSQRRLSAIQMINFLMKCIDSRSIFSELAMIVDVLEKCDSDQMPFVRGAAFEALQTARMIAADKGSKFEKDSSSITGSNFRRDHSRRNLWGGSRDNRNRRGSRSPRPMSPESHTVNSFIEYDSLMDSPLSTGQASCNFAYGSHANRKLWRCENGGVDVSLKDGLYSAAGYGDDRLKSYVEHFGDGGLSDVEGDRLEAFSGFAQASSPTNTITRSATPSPQRSQSQLNADDIRIFTTPRKLIRSLQDPDDVSSDFFEKQAEKIRSPASCEVGWEPTREMNGSDGSPDSLNYVVRGKQNCERVQSNLSWKNKATDAEPELDGFESVSSTGDVDPDAKNCKELYEARGRENNGMRTVGPKRTSFRKAAALSLVCGLTLILPAIILSTMWLDNHDEYFNLVPT